VDELSPDLYYLNLYFQGEPYLHPRFNEMITYAKSKKIYVSTSTNGHFLTNENISRTIESGLDKLIISLDGTDDKTYQQYRIGGNFNEVLRGIAELVRQKKSSGSKTPKIILQFLVLKSNQHQLNDIRKLGKELGVDKVELKTAQFYDFRNGNVLMPERRYSRYIKNKNAGADQPAFKIQNGMPDHCFRMWSSSVVTWDGKVVPCCFDKDAAHMLGNLKDNTFWGIWRNGGYKDFRKKILSSRKSLDICTNCTEGSGITSIL
jgi:radical SAM protein with 4Fe4S-binding SPASM domain